LVPFLLQKFIMKPSWTAQYTSSKLSLWKENKVSTSKTHSCGRRGPNTVDVNSRAAFAALNARIVHTHLSTITSNPEKGKLERQLKMLLQQAFKLNGKLLCKVLERETSTVYLLVCHSSPQWCLGRRQSSS